LGSQTPAHTAATSDGWAHYMCWCKGAVHTRAQKKIRFRDTAAGSDTKHTCSPTLAVCCWCVHTDNTRRCKPECKASSAAQAATSHQSVSLAAAGPQQLAACVQTEPVAALPQSPTQCLSGDQRQAGTTARGTQTQHPTAARQRCLRLSSGGHGCRCHGHDKTGAAAVWLVLCQRLSGSDLWGCCWPLTPCQLDLGWC
jgi:hypothetical protein